MQKAQGLSLNVIIIALIGLVVLIVLVAVFTGKISLFGKNVVDCKAKGGDRCKENCEPNEAAIVGTNCAMEDINKMCCIPT